MQEKNFKKPFSLQNENRWNRKRIPMESSTCSTRVLHEERYGVATFWLFEDFFDLLSNNTQNPWTARACRKTAHPLSLRRRLGVPLPIVFLVGWFCLLTCLLTRLFACLLADLLLWKFALKIAMKICFLSCLLFILTYWLTDLLTCLLSYLLT